MYQSINMNIDTDLSLDDDKHVYANGNGNRDDDDDDDNDDEVNVNSYNSDEEYATEASIFDADHGATIIRDKRKTYQFMNFVPSWNPRQFFPWLVNGFSPHTEMEKSEVERSTLKMARMISLLREYEDRFGIPRRGGSKEQLWVLTELCTRLYASGTPLWVLKPVMSKAAEGLTGSRQVDFVLFTRSAFIYSPSNVTTASFPMERGFDMRMVTVAERILVRLASFASNSRSVHAIQADFPSLQMLIKAARGQSVMAMGKSERREMLAKDILDLASEGTGLFYLLNQKLHGDGIGSELKSNDPRVDDPATNEIRDFWEIEDAIKEVFTRLVTIEAVSSLQALKAAPPTSHFYPRYVILIFRTISSAGAAGLWLHASWYDMIVAGALSILVAWFEGAGLWKHEKMIFEVIVSFIVGLLAGLISIKWEIATCFQAIAVGAIIDILQGFRVVYSIMEIMSKHTISGGADFLESLLFTGLIAYFLKFGLSAAELIMDRKEDAANFVCHEPIDQKWYFLLLPITALSWSVLFTPLYRDLPLMTMHGILSYLVYFGITQIPDTDTEGAAIFVAAATVTFTAGFISRFTGRQALGDTVTGLYVLLPGSYLARGLFSTAGNKSLDGNLLMAIVFMAVTIGLGGWTGTMLCSPTILGTNNGLLKNFMNKRLLDKRDISMLRTQEDRHKRKRDLHDQHDVPGSAMLFF